MTWIAIGPQTYTNILSGTGVDSTGASDSTTGIAAVRSAVNAAGGGVVYWPPGTYLSGNQPLYSNVIDMGAGPAATIIKLKNGANTDLFSANTASINLGGAYGTGSSIAAADFGFMNLTLDGNKANQLSGPSYPLRFYGRSYTLQNVHVREGYSGGILCDYNGTADPAEDSPGMWLSHVQIHDNNGFGIEMGGPSDSQWDNVWSFHNSSAAIHICPNASALQVTNIHCYTQGTLLTNMPTGLIEATDCVFTNAEFEGSNEVMLAILGDHTTFIGKIFPGGSATGAGIKIGQQAGQTPYTGQIYQSGGVTIAVAPFSYHIFASIYNIASSNGGIWFANDGQGVVRAVIAMSSGNYISGTPAGSSQIDIWGKGLTADGSVGKGGEIVVSSSSFAGYVIQRAADGTIALAVDTYDSPPLISIPNNTTLRFYSDNFTTLGVVVKGGVLSVGQSATAPAIATSGTIATAGLGVSRVASTANVTGIILAVGTQPGQMVTVINESAFTITFAAAATSNIADGVSAVIAANRKMDFTWDSATSRWYHN